MTAHRAVTGASTQGGAPSTYRPARQTSRRAGFIAAALVNGVFLWVVNQLLSWGWPPFLTDDFTDLLPFVDVSLASTVVVNGIWAWRDPSWFRHGAQIGLDCISLVVAVRTW